MRTRIGTSPEINKVAPVAEASDRLTGQERTLVPGSPHRHRMMDPSFLQGSGLRTTRRGFVPRHEPLHLRFSAIGCQTAPVGAEANQAVVHRGASTVVADFLG